MTAIRGYVRLGGLPDNPRTDPQDRAWFGPHDRLFVEEESEPVEFVSGPEYGESYLVPPVVPPAALNVPHSTSYSRIWGYVRSSGWHAIDLDDCGIFDIEL